jgi:Ca-activated chloride channel family protein
MTREEIILLAAWAALGAGLLGLFAEWLHARRVRRLGRLAFGPDERPRAWTRATPLLRTLALGGLAWSAVVLMAFDGASRARETNVAATRHLMVLLDVSPSMQLKDAGEHGGDKRATQAAKLLRSVMERATGDQVKITMGCFYTDALLLVSECADREVIWNFANDLPLYIAYQPGKTDLVKSLNKAGTFVKDFPRKTTTVLVLSDGDTVPDSGLKPMPSSVSEVIFAGVGSPGHGTFIDGHLSRQDSASLQQLARRLGGHYHNGNVKNIPSELLRKLTSADERPDRFKVSLRILAIIVLTASAALLCLLPLLLECLGSAWKPAVPASRQGAASFDNNGGGLPARRFGETA